MSTENKIVTYQFVENIITVSGIVLVMILAPDFWKLLSLVLMGNINCWKRVAK